MASSTRPERDGAARESHRFPPRTGSRGASRESGWCCSPTR
ncbi:hypothetical protein ACFU90_00020 [Streptomyces noursei]